MSYQSHDLLSTQQVAELLGLPAARVRNWRYTHQGPPYTKTGREVRYRFEDVQEWLDRNTRGGQHSEV